MKYNFYPFANRREGCIIAKEKNNKCVLQSHMGHMLGYVIFGRNEIPKEWHGNYRAPGLQSLAIHGGITYAECETNNKYIKRALLSIGKLIALTNGDKKLFGHKIYLHWQYRTALLRWFEKLCYDYVVFGFDCGHAGDDENAELKNPDYVMMLTEQMESQMKALAAIWKQFKKMTKEQKIDALDEISQKGCSVNLGLGQMIEMLCGAKSLD